MAATLRTRTPLMLVPPAARGRGCCYLILEPREELHSEPHLATATQIPPVAALPPKGASRAATEASHTPVRRPTFQNPHAALCGGQASPRVDGPANLRKQHMLSMLPSDCGETASSCRCSDGKKRLLCCVACLGGS
jgi:hypothetical protein